MWSGNRLMAMISKYFRPSCRREKTRATRGTCRKAKTRHLYH